MPAKISIVPTKLLIFEGSMPFWIIQTPPPHFPDDTLFSFEEKNNIYEDQVKIAVN